MMDPKVLKEHIENYKKGELKLHSSFTQQEKITLPPLNEIYQYGEVYFLLAGLKPAVLYHFAYLDPKIVHKKLVQNFLQPWLEQSKLSDQFSVFQVKHKVSSPGCGWYKGAVVLYNNQYKNLVNSVFGNEKLSNLKEENIQKVLDFPTEWDPNGDNHCIEYKERKGNEFVCLQEYFCKDDFMEKRPQIFQHYLKYLKASEDVFDLHLFVDDNLIPNQALI